MLRNEERKGGDKMTRTVIIAVLALALLLFGASVVFAQSGNPGYGHRMMQSPVAPGNEPAPGNSGDTTTPGAVCPMAGGDGAGIVNAEDMQAAHEAMQNGNWEEMFKQCRKAWEQNQGNQPTSTT